MEFGIPITMLGVVAIVVGWATYAAGFDKTIGLVGVGLGVVLVIVGVVLWMMRGKTPAPTPPKTEQQPEV